MANLFLNELDWTLAEHRIRFVRYADDFLLFAKTEEDIEKAAEIIKRKTKLAELAFEIAEEKTKFVDFHDDDFDFLGFTFGHWRKRKKDGVPYYKAKTRKTLTISKEKWVEQVNPVIRGKVNDYHTIHKAIQLNAQYGIGSRCFYKTFGKELQAIDRYIRKRLRVAMIHDHPSQRKGWKMTMKWNNEFFARLGLVPCALSPQMVGLRTGKGETERVESSDGRSADRKRRNRAR
ncbi:reverse transcriptase domain-containing protein [Salicibibacter kimchii]|uniref:reverse transcriptase domain-containing protein n=1 Tax=Salicibibacter kimchii TaxID=2099786 RepID=UPI001D04677C|nr:reverse transcriptase domain-containing protein [Salicibibacter kimchii]